jgi:drug/metabolite transporter (DMT)-like permease
MTWLFVTILAYFLFALANLIEKYLLKASLPNPKVFTFYVGIMAILVLVFVPFGFLKIPKLSLIFLAMIAGIIRIFSLFFLFLGLKNFEVSRIAPAIGGLVPIFTLVFTYFLGGKTEIPQIFALIFLIFGSILIVFEKEKLITVESLKISGSSAFLFSLSFVLSKFVYLAQPFLSGLIWIMLGQFLGAIFFLFSKEVREEIFKKKEILERKTATIFLFDQAIGALAFVLQNFAVALAPFGFLAFINALEGTKYLFLLIFSILLSLKFPQILKEEISRKILIQKIVAIFLIGIGLAILALSK